MILLNTWNFANVWETVAEAVPERVAQVHGENRVTWAEMDHCANGVAATLVKHDLAAQDKVALLLFNGPEYMQSVFAAL